MAMNTLPTYYRSQSGDRLEVCDTYKYRVEVGKIANSSFSLIDSRYVNVKAPTKSKMHTLSHNINGETFIKDIELVGAPIDFLVKNGYKIENA